MEFLNHLFNIAPGQSSKYYIPMLAFTGLLIISAIIFSIIYKKKKKTDFAFKRLFKNLSNRLVLFGILTLVLIGIRYENIPYFSMRLWLYLTLIAFLYFVVYKYIKIYKTDYPREKQNVQYKQEKQTANQEEKRYLPNKKKKK